MAEENHQEVIRDGVDIVHEHETVPTLHTVSMSIHQLTSSRTEGCPKIAQAQLPVRGPM